MGDRQRCAGECVRGNGVLQDCKGPKKDGILLLVSGNGVPGSGIGSKRVLRQSSRVLVLGL
jgi:hypothetical protein